MGRLDAAAVGNGGAVRVPGAEAAWLVSASGVGYPVLDAATAAAVGIGAAEPASEAVLRLLPDGPPVDVRGAGRVLDLLPATLLSATPSARCRHVTRSPGAHRP